MKYFINYPVDNYIHLMTVVLYKSFSPVKISFLVLSLIFLYSCSTKKRDLSQPTSNFRLITYNVWYGFTKAPERKTRWIEWMQAQQPDVVSLQELNEYTAQMLAEDAESWGHKYSILLKEDGFPTGVTSKYPIQDVQRFMEGFHHGLLRVKIKNLYFYIIHLHPSNWETRNREVGLIITDIKNLPEKSSVILAGDFNTFSPFDSVYYRHGRLEPFFHQRDVDYKEVNLKNGKLDYSVMDTLLDNGLIDLENKMRPSDYEFTGSFPTLIEKEGNHGDQRRLDYVFAGKNMEERVIRAEIIANDTTLILSDHLPMIVDIQID